MWSVAYNGAKLSENYKENEKEKWRGQNNIMEKSLIQGFDKLKDVNKIWGYIFLLETLNFDRNCYFQKYINFKKFL